MNILSSTSGTKTLSSMIFSGNGIGNYNRINNYNQNHLVNDNSNKNLIYYMIAKDFITNTIVIPTSNNDSNSTNSSSYFAGRTTLFDLSHNPCGTCGATFLNIQVPNGFGFGTGSGSNIYTQIYNFLTIDNGLIISWLTPTNPINLEIDSILNSMVTECIVTSTTKIGVNPYYGKTFNMVVSSNKGIIMFNLTQIN
jgi:hypothetical protein